MSYNTVLMVSLRLEIVVSFPMRSLVFASRESSVTEDHKHEFINDRIGGIGAGDARIVLIETMVHTIGQPFLRGRMRWQLK